MREGGENKEEMTWQHQASFFVRVQCPPSYCVLCDNFSLFVVLSAALLLFCCTPPFPLRATMLSLMSAYTEEKEEEKATGQIGQKEREREQASTAPIFCFPTRPSKEGGRGLIFPASSSPPLHHHQRERGGIEFRGWRAAGFVTFLCLSNTCQARQAQLARGVVSSRQHSRENKKRSEWGSSIQIRACVCEHEAKEFWQPILNCDPPTFLLPPPFDLSFLSYVS